MVTIRFILDRFAYIWAILPLLTWKRTWNLLVSIGYFLIRSSRSAATPPFLILSLTSDCNYSCIMCLKTSAIQSGHLDYTVIEEMDYEVLSEFIRRHHEYLFFIRLHGGEPLVYTHFLDLVKLLNELKIPYDIVTNGSFLQGEVLDELVGSYCVNISVSLDAASESTYRRVRAGGNLNVISNNLTQIKLKKAQSRTTRPVMNASMCVFMFNLKEMSPLIGFCSEHGITSLSVSEGVNYGTSEILDTDLVRNNKTETHKEIKRAVIHAKRHNLVLRLKFSSLEDRKYGDIPYHKARQKPHNCLNLYGSIWMTPSFDIIGCSSSTEVFGNLLVDDFKMVWQSGENGYPSARRTFADSKVPLNCEKCLYSGGFFDL